MIVVELTHDLVCPWCRIGHHRLREAIARSDKAVRIDYRPFQLEPSTPPEGFDLRERLASKYGAASLDSMFARVTAIGKQDGLVFDFAKVTRHPSTLLAHMMVDAAPIDQKSAVVDALHQAYFVDGKDIGAAKVLREVLPGAWVDAVFDDEHRRAMVEKAARAASQSGIGGVPHFVFNGPSGKPITLHGAQPQAEVLAALARV